MKKLSVVIRNKNQALALKFLLCDLRERYNNDIDEIVVIDNLSTDNSKQVTGQYNARFETIEKFTYGGSANFAALKASHPIVVIFSAHSYPVSHDFFKLIKKRFEENTNLAGLRCLHNGNDYRNYINGITANEDPNKSGLIFSGSAFSRDIWKQHPFREDVSTFEDKEWSKRVLEAGYDIEFVPSIFSYEITRTNKQDFFRFKNDVIGNYQLWYQDVSLKQAINGLLGTWHLSLIGFFISVWYALKRFLFIIQFQFNKPRKF